MAMTTLRSLTMLVTFVAVACLSGCQGAGSGGSNNQGPSNNALLPPEEDAKLNIAVAQGHEESGDDAEAIRHYERGRALDPAKNQWVCRRLAVLYDRVGDTYRAEREYKKAIKLEPNDSSLLNDLGYFYFQRERYPEAEQNLRRAVELDPSNGRAWNNLGLTLAWTERYDEAREAFVNVVSPAEASANVGIVMAQQGKFPEAEAELQRALAQQPDLQRYNSVIEQIRRQMQGGGEDVIPPDAGDGPSTW